MIDMRLEPLITLEDAAKLVPGFRANCCTSVGAVRRWALEGMRGVRLETVIAGGRRCTSREALQRFISGLTEARDGRQVAKKKPGRSRNAKAALKIKHGIEY